MSCNKEELKNREHTAEGCNKFNHSLRLNEISEIERNQHI